MSESRPESVEVPASGPSLGLALPLWSLRALFVLLALATLACVATQPSWASLLAPLAGPWAGVLLGHSDCTMGNAIPAYSIGNALALAAGAVLTVRLRGAARSVALVATALALLSWLVLAFLSVANTTS